MRFLWSSLGFNLPSYFMLFRAKSEWWSRDGIFCLLVNVAAHRRGESWSLGLGSAIPLKLSERSAKTNNVSSVRDTRHLTFKLLCSIHLGGQCVYVKVMPPEVIYLCNILVSRRWGETLKLVKTHFYLLLQTL